MSFLRNVWYAAGWASELVAGQLLARRLLDEPLVFFRDASGAPRALYDRCPHRFAPLSMGKMCDGKVECPYHGLQFDPAGQCVHNPHSEVIPIAAKVKAYPLVERYSMLWIWMGDAERADPATIPDFSCMDPDTWYVGQSYLHVKSDYRLENDNILDLSHIQYLHPTTLGSKSLEEGKTEVTQEGNQVWAKRTLKNEVISDFIYLANGLPVGTPVDRWIDVRWDPPCSMWLLQRVVPTGQPQPPVEGQVITPHIFTPETAGTTHYWFGFCMEKKFNPEGDERSKLGVQFLEAPFRDEDLPLLEAVQARMQGQEFWSLKPVLLAPDAASVRVRRLLDKLIAEEQKAMSAVVSAVV